MLFLYTPSGSQVAIEWRSDDTYLILTLLWENKSSYSVVIVCIEKVALPSPHRLVPVLLNGMRYSEIDIIILKVSHMQATVALSKHRGLTSSVCVCSQ